MEVALIHRMSLVDGLIVLAFVAYAITQGFRSRELASQNLEEYFLAGRSLTGWKAGISMAATQFSADTPLLVTGLIATAGVFSLWRLWIYGIAFLLMGFVLGGAWRRVGVLTDAELTEVRYGSQAAPALRAVKALYLGLFFNCVVLAWVLLAVARIAEPFLLWNEWLPAGVFQAAVSLVRGLELHITVGTDSGQWIRSANNFVSILAILTVTTLYSTTGGLRSVVATDLVQFAIMMVGTALFAGYVVHHAGGLGGLSDRIHTMFADGGPAGLTPNQILAFDPSQAKDATLAILVVFAIQWLVQINSDGTGYLAQRTMACKSDADARQAAVIFTVAQIVLRSLLWLPIGVGLLVVFPPDLLLEGDAIKAAREATYVDGIAELLPVGMVGILLTGMLAALASTVDTHLNWGSSYLTNDIFKRFVAKPLLGRVPDARMLVWVARVANLLILLLALYIMTKLSSIQDAWITSLLLGAGLGIVFLLRWLWWRVSAWTEVSAIVASFVLAVLLLGDHAEGMLSSVATSDTELEAIRLLVMAVGATGVALLVTLLTEPEDMERLKDFYQRAKPPGFWKPVAEALGQDPEQPKQRLKDMLVATLLSSISIFCLLTSIGSLTIGSSAPTFLPWRAVWIGGLFLTGCALIPLWWRRVR